MTVIDLWEIGTVHADGATVDLRASLAAGVEDGSIVLARSPSEEYRLEVVPSSDARRMRLYSNEALVSSWQLPYERSSHAFLLDDGTYMALERVSCQSSGAEQTIVVVSSAGATLWSRQVKSLLPETYLLDLERSPNLGRRSAFSTAPPIRWKRDVHAEGSTLQDAKLVVRLANDDLLEIRAHDAATFIIPAAAPHNSAAGPRGE